MEAICWEWTVPTEEDLSCTPGMCVDTRYPDRERRVFFFSASPRVAESVDFVNGQPDGLEVEWTKAGCAGTVRGVLGDRYRVLFSCPGVRERCRMDETCDRVHALDRDYEPAQDVSVRVLRGARDVCARGTRFVSLRDLWG